MAYRKCIPLELFRPSGKKGCRSHLVLSSVLWLVLSTALLLVLSTNRTYADDSDSEPNGDQFSVTTHKLEAKKTSPREIQLLSPPHKATFTPGIILFAWKFRTPKHVATYLRVERLDGSKKFSKKVRTEKKLLDLTPGDYRWQVATSKPGLETRWRLLKVIGLKSRSITELFEETNEKSIMADSGITDESPEPDLQPHVAKGPIPLPASLRRTPASTELAPLDAPAWVKHH